MTTKQQAEALSAFAEARLAEDKTAADEAARDECPDWRRSYPNPGMYAGTTDITDITMSIVARVGTPVASHIARHDPARALREVEAKHLVFAEHLPIVSIYGLTCGKCVTWPAAPWTEGGGGPEFGIATPDPWPCVPVRAALAGWEGHADYQSSWKL